MGARANLGTEDRERLEAIVRQVASCEFRGVSLRAVDDEGNYEFSYFDQSTGRQEAMEVRLFAPWNRTLEDALWQSAEAFWVPTGEAASATNYHMSGIHRRLEQVKGCMSMGFTVSL